MVCLDGSNLSISGSGSLYATLPEGFRPSTYVNGIFNYGQTRTGDLVVQKNGEILLWPQGENTVTMIRAQIIFPT